MFSSKEKAAVVRDASRGVEKGNILSETRKAWVGAARTEEYGIQDIGGKQPGPLTFETS